MEHFSQVEDDERYHQDGLTGRYGKYGAQKFGFIGQLLLVITFLINLTTTLAIAWLIISLKLYTDPKSILSNELKSSPEDQLIFNRDLLVDSMIVYEGLQTNLLDSEKVCITGTSKRSGTNPEIYIDSRQIYMQAESFQIDDDQVSMASERSPTGQLTFRLQKVLNNLEVSQGISNVRALRSIPRTSLPLQREDSDSDSTKKLHQAGQLMVNSQDKLELSGNQGIVVYSRKIDLKSSIGGQLGLISKVGAIVLRSSDGSIRLPQLQLMNQGSFMNFADRRQHRLNIDKNTGKVYQDERT